MLVAGSPGEARLLEPSPPGATAPSRRPITPSTRASGRSSGAHILAAGRGWAAPAYMAEARLFVQQTSPYLFLGCDLGDPCLASHRGPGQARKPALKASSVPVSLPIFPPTAQSHRPHKVQPVTSWSKAVLDEVSPLEAGVGMGAGSVAPD